MVVDPVTFVLPTVNSPTEREGFKPTDWLMQASRLSSPMATESVFRDLNEMPACHSLYWSLQDNGDWRQISMDESIVTIEST